MQNNNMNSNPNPSDSTNIDDLINMNEVVQPTQFPHQDIPISTENMMHDTNVLPNNVGNGSGGNNDKKYIDEFDNLYNMIDNNEKNDKQKNVEQPTLPITDDIKIDDFILPLFVAFLFFLFQQSFVNKFLKSLIPQLFDNGNINIMGLIAKSILFGVSYYFASKLIFI